MTQDPSKECKPTWARDIAGPVMHALVIGVAGYPSAKKGKGYDATLRGVEDVPCAVASARRMADWLFDNKDILTPPLASIDLLLSEAPADPDRHPYPMKLQPQRNIENATSQNVEAHGDAWYDRFKEGDSAFFFISGHGATSKDNDAVVFLEDLNGNKKVPWGAYLNISETAQVFKSDKRLKAAFFFSDACQEFSERFWTVDSGDGVRIGPGRDPILFASAREKVAFITAASQGLLTLEGDWKEDSKVKMGRFTQVLVQALDGASARPEDAEWTVCAESVASDLKNLYRLRNWKDTFEPSTVLGQNERFSIVRHTQPKVPVIVCTQPPDRVPDCSLEIFLPPDRSKDAIERCDPGPREFWEVWIPASLWTHLVVVTHSSKKSVEIPITPNQPIFSRMVPFS